MAETLTVITPPVSAVANDYRVMCVTLDWERAEIAIVLKDATGQRIGHHYRGAVAVALMRGLNKADLSVKSLHRRILERLIADGVVSGTVGGVPD